MSPATTGTMPFCISLGAAHSTGALGTSPGRYFRELRLGAARRLVVDTGLPMTEVAVRTGFGSASAFSRAFVRRFGASAGAMRREARG